MLSGTPPSFERPEGDSAAAGLSRLDLSGEPREGVQSTAADPDNAVGLKPWGRAVEKLAMCYLGDPARLVDCCRCEIGSGGDRERGARRGDGAAGLGLVN